MNIRQESALGDLKNLPFIERTNSPDMIHGVYADRYMLIYMGEDVDEKYWTLRRKALIFGGPGRSIT